MAVILRLPVAHLCLDTFRGCPSHLASEGPSPANSQIPIIGGGTERHRAYPDTRPPIGRIVANAVAALDAACLAVGDQLGEIGCHPSTGSPPRRVGKLLARMGDYRRRNDCMGGASGDGSHKYNPRTWVGRGTARAGGKNTSVKTVVNMLARTALYSIGSFAHREVRIYPVTE